MSVVSLVILLVNVVCGVVLEDVVAAVPLDTVEALVMVAGDVLFSDILFLHPILFSSNQCSV